MSDTGNSTATASVSVACDPTLDKGCAPALTPSDPAPVTTSQDPSPPAQKGGFQKISILAWIALGANATEFIAALTTFFGDIYD